VLDGAFDILRFRLGRFVALAAVFFVPLLVAQFALGLAFGFGDESTGGGVLASPLVFIGGANTSWGIPLFIANQIALSSMGIAVGFSVGSWLAGTDPTFGITLRYAARRVWVAAVLVVLTWMLRIPLSCVPLVGLWIGDALTFIASTTAGAERLGPLAAMKRSIGLTRRAFGLCMVIALGGFAISSVIKMALWAGPVALVSFVVPSSEVATSVGRFGSLVLLVSEPLVACIAARAWLELRCRTEGLDLERWRDAL